jgi:hypothetical protein
MLRAAHRGQLRAVLAVLEQEIAAGKGLARDVRAVIDVDPVQLL